MPRTPDRFPGTREEEGIVFQPTTIQPSVDGEIRYVETQGFFYQENGVVKPFSAGLDEPSHEILNTLTHDIATSHYLELTRDVNRRITHEIYWTDSSKTQKIREFQYTRNSRGHLLTEVKIQYDNAGAVKKTLTTTYQRDATLRVSGYTVTST